MSKPEMSDDVNNISYSKEEPDMFLDFICPIMGLIGIILFIVTIIYLGEAGYLYELRLKIKLP